MSEGLGRSRPSADTGLELHAPTLVDVSCHRATSACPVTDQAPGDRQGVQELQYLSVKTDKEREKSHQAPLVEASLASVNTDCHSARHRNVLAKRFYQSSDWEEVQQHPPAARGCCHHSLPGYFSGNEIPTHKEVNINNTPAAGRYSHTITHISLLRMQVAASESPKTYVLSERVNLC